MASNPQIIAFQSRDALAARVGDLVEAALERALAADHRAAMAVSGGSTPKALYEELARREIFWSDVGVTLVDERWVGQEHPRSNERFVRDSFAAASGVQITGLYNGALSPAAGAADIDAKIAQQKKPFDVVILGMGDDGHTASWFPYAAGLSDALDSNKRVCAVRASQSDVTGEETDRITLTLSAIQEARLIVLLITGESKKKALERAFGGGPVEEMPVRAILRARPDLWICWAK